MRGVGIYTESTDECLRARCFALARTSSHGFVYTHLHRIDRVSSNRAPYLEGPRNFPQHSATLQYQMNRRTMMHIETALAGEDHHERKHNGFGYGDSRRLAQAPRGARAHRPSRGDPGSALCSSRGLKAL